MKLFNLHLFVNYRYNYCWLFILLIYQCLTLLADARSKLAHYQTILCADLQCQEPISDGLTTTKYPSPEEIFLSFKQNSNVKIFGKTSDNHFYFAEINKKRGFVPAKLIKETKVHLENAKLSNVQFDFEGLKRTLSIKINSVDNHSNDSVVLSSSDQRVDDIQSNTATPFVYSQKVTVIDGTTIDEDLLQTATPSPTFAENSVTKTATIQANFSDVEFDKTTVSQKLGELSKEHGSLYKLAKPIDNDVIVESEDSSEQIEDVIITSEPTNIENVSADNAEKMDKRENVSPENTHTDDDTNVDTSPIDENEKQTEENPESIQNEEEKVEMSTSVDNTEENSLVNESDEPSSMDSTITDNKIELLNDEETIQADLTSNDTTHSGSMTNFPNPSADTTMNVDSSTKNTDNLPNDSSSLSASNNNAADDQQLNESKLNTEDNNQLPNSLVNDNSNKEQVKQEQNQPSFSANEVPVSDSINAQNQYPHQQSLHHQNPARHHQQQQVYYQQQPGQYHQQQPVQYQQPQQPVQYQQPQQSGQYQQPQQPVQYQQPQQPVQYQQPQQPVQYQHQQQHVHYHHQQQPGQYQQPLQYQQQPVQHQPQTVQHPPQPVQYQQQPVQHQQQRIQHPPPQIQNPSQQAQHPQQQIQHPPPKVQSTTQPTQQPVQHPHIRNRRTNYEINNPNIGLNINQGNPNQPLNSENQQQIPGQNQQPSIDTKSQESTQQHAHPVNQPLHQHETSINSRLKRDNLHSEINQSDNITTNDDNINSDNNIDKPENILLPPTINSEQNNKNLPDLLSHHSLLNNNVIKRKFLAERVGIVSVIMDIIPDEVELFFESFNISLHAIIFTSIVAFFWCLMKMIIFFISSSKMSRELRGTICETQRKLYYVEAENDKLKEECSTFRNESTGFRSNLNKIEKRKYQLEQENEKIKNEITSLRKENSTLKLLNESNDKSSTLLDSLRTELDEYKQESLDANVKINELQNQIDLHLSTIKELKEKSSADKEKIQNLNEELEGLNDKVEKSNKLADEAEQKFRILHLDNVDLKEQQSQLNMEMKEIKDELLSSQEKIQNFTDENNTLKENAINLEEKIASLSLSLENKEAEITSMQTLLKKLNKNKNNDHDRKRRSVMGDENGIINDDDLNDDETLDTMENDKLNENVQDETDSLMDVVQLQVCLAKLESEKKQLEQKYNDLLKQKNDMEHDIEGMKKLNEKLKSEAEDALNEKTKAMIKLEVLTEHYNAKELDYAKDLGVFKVKQEQQNVDVESLNTKLGMLQDENIGLKDHVKRIQKEMEDSERYYKGQLRNLEKQSHENWFAAKSAEQKYEQSKAEASVLRQMFSQSMKSPPPSEHFGNFDDSASSVSSIPDMLNSSLIVPPPPPIPPFIFPSMFGQQSIPNNQPTQTLPAPSVPAIQFYDTNGSNASSQAYSTNQTYNTNPNSSYNTNSIYNSPSTYTSPPAYNTDSTYNTNPTYNSNQSYSSNNTSGYWNSPPTPAAPAAVSSSTAQTPITNINYSYNTATPNNMIISTTATNISSNVSNMNYSQPNLNTNSMHTNTMQYSTDTGGNHHRPHSTSSNNYVDVYFGP